MLSSQAILDFYSDKEIYAFGKINFFISQWLDNINIFSLSQYFSAVFIESPGVYFSTFIIFILCVFVLIFLNNSIISRDLSVDLLFTNTISVFLGNKSITLWIEWPIHLSSFFKSNYNWIIHLFLKI